MHPILRTSGITTNFEYSKRSEVLKFNSSWCASQLILLLTWWGGGVNSFKLEERVFTKLTYTTAGLPNYVAKFGVKTYFKL
jgi:hypothetical protein